jgi:mannose/fructose-specific phosphotransferase system component IIA
MSDVAGVVVAHADLAGALVGVAEKISGMTGALTPVSNEGCSPGDLHRRIAAAAGEGPCIVFVDLISGSCGFASRSVAEQSSNIAVITGVSLPLLLDFLFHRHMSLGKLAGRLVEKGHAGTRAFLPSTLDDASRAVPD